VLLFCSYARCKKETNSLQDPDLPVYLNPCQVGTVARKRV